MSNLLEIYDLMEWTDPQASKDFWSQAKENKIDDKAFRRAYEDELRKLKLWDLIDSSYNGTGILKEKGSYGPIKKSSEENPDSWAIKALLKMWVLQFKNNVKSNSQLARDAESAALSIKIADWEELNKKLPELEEIAIEAGLDIIRKALEEINSKIRYNNKLIDDTIALTNGFAGEKHAKATEITSDNLFKVNVNSEKPTYSTDDITVRITITEIFGKNTQYNNNLRPTDYSVVIGSVDATPETINSKVEKLLNSLLPKISNNIGNLFRSEYYQKEYDESVRKVNMSKAAQEAVDTGRPVDPDFIAEVIAVFKNGLAKAEKESASWASWKYDDGDSGAAFEHEKYKTMNAAAVYLSNCNWRSYVKDHEIAVWRTTDSENALETALSKTFNATCTDLNIEIIK